MVKKNILQPVKQWFYFASVTGFCFSLYPGKFGIIFICVLVGVIHRVKDVKICVIRLRELQGFF
jgi:hypothetical protein